MKNQVLSIEQMKHLKELGVDVSKGSMVCLFIDEDGIEIDWALIENHGSDKTYYRFDDEYEHTNGEVGGWIPTTPTFYDAETGYYDHSNRESCGVFTLQDMLEMMPKELKLKVEEYRRPIDCILIIDASSNCVAYEYSQWGRIGSAESFSDDAILGAVYKTLCWLAENEHLTKKEE